MSALEIEIKLNVLPNVAGGPAAFFTRLAARHRLGPFQLGPVRRHNLRDVYFDTAEGSFSAARVALRLREQDGERYVTLKAGRRHEGALAVRDESESPLTAASLAWELAALVDRGLLSAPQAAAVDVEAFGAGVATGPLRPVLTASTERLERAASRPGSIVARLSFDVVQYVGLGCAPLYDAEAELTSNGSESDLSQLQLLLTDAAGGALAPGLESKLARGLRLAESR